MELVSIIVPAYKAEAFIDRPVRSVMEQTYPHWELLLIADDGVNYESVLKQKGIQDLRIRFLSTGSIATGQCHARNTGMEAARGNILAILDADDKFYPEKLVLAVPQAITYGLVACALDIYDNQGKKIKQVGIGRESGEVPGTAYKAIHFTMDSMVLLDKRKIPVRYDESFSHLVDFEFILQCFKYVRNFYHFSLPLHAYYKQPGSVSTGLGAPRKYMQAKRRLLQRLKGQYYPFADPQMGPAMQKFLMVSWEAEKVWETRLKKGEKILFEEVLEGMLSDRVSL